MLKKKIYNDIILVLIILLIVSASFVYISFNKKTGKKAIIKQDGRIIQEIELSQRAKYKVKIPGGGYNTIVVKNGQVSMLNADCKDQICVKHAPIKFDREVIVCLPHRLSVEIISDDKADVDMVVE